MMVESVKQHKPFGFGDGTYQAIGGHDGLVQLVGYFYEAMDALPEAKKIRGMHTSPMDISNDKLVHFLSGWTGGPEIYGDKFGPIRLPMAHMHILIDESDRDAWLLCMAHALVKHEATPALKTYLLHQLSFPAERIREVSQAHHAKLNN